MEAFRAALDAGADGLELDVRLSRDGHLFVFHDSALTRLVGTPGRFGDRTRAEIRSLTLAGGAAIPEWREVLEAFPDALLNVEIKSAPWRSLSAAVRECLAAVAGDPRPERIIVSSFDRRVLPLVSPQKRVQSALLVGRYARPPACLPAGASALHLEDAQVSRRQVARCRRLGLALRVYTVDRPARIRELADWGVDGIISNDPASALAALT